jgi:hypothetical protein
MGSYAAEQETNRDAQIINDFQNRVTEYVKLRKSVESSMPALKPTDTPEIIKQHQLELANKIRQARTDARQGDIFTPEIAAEFTRLMGFAMDGGKSQRIHKSLKSAEPVRAAFRVNDIYPDKIPLQSAPPTLLLNLPHLPKELEYRIVSKSLLLRDVTANVIVDFIPGVMP